jgi:serine protease Do
MHDCVGTTYRRHHRVATLLCAALAASQLVSSSGAAEKSSPRPKPPRSVEVARQLSDAISWASDQVKPAVVTIRHASASATAGTDDGAQPRRAPQRQHLGSGVIVDPEGYIVTNYHVVGGAATLKVNIADDWRKTYEARVIATDPRSDLAVIKIDGEKFSFARLGNSDLARVGDWVVAIGVPFGLTQSVTAGIISALNRTGPGGSGYVEMIQTDAAVNPGNSGGPLVSLDGEIVGINTAIRSTSGGFEGVGFAIPSNTVRELLPVLKRGGKVARGYLGVQLQDITEEVARANKLPEARGVVVASVLKNGPAERAGLQPKDVIVQFNGKNADDVAQLRSMVGATKPEMIVPVQIWRYGERLTVKLKVGELPEPTVAAAPRPAGLGVRVQNLTPELAEKYGYTQMELPVITSVETAGAAANAGLKEGDLIMSVNQQRVRTAEEFEKLARAEDGPLELQVRNKGGVRVVELSPR